MCSGPDGYRDTPGAISAVQEYAWQQVQQSVEVELVQEPDELWVLARSKARRDKEAAIRRQKLHSFFRGLSALRRSRPQREALLRRLGAVKHQAAKVASAQDLRHPTGGFTGVVTVPGTPKLGVACGGNLRPYLQNNSVSGAEVLRLE
ncbi:MAG: hypothetical protein HKL96_04085 [Phycisphaerales bacterium]|nr:hypothetical protein [Phycisphaerales bacterium]